MDIRILTVRQPWATALVAAGKDVENRRWGTAYRGWILVHAGKAIDGQAPRIPGLGDPRALPLGGVVGAIRLDDVRRDHRGPWADPGCWHWYHDPSVAIRLDDPISWRGGQGLTRAPSSLLQLLPERVTDRIGCPLVSSSGGSILE